MLLQGTSVKLLPSVRNFIEDECNLSYNYDFPVIKKSNEKHQKNYPSILDESAFTSKVEDERKSWNCTEEYYEKLLETNKDPTIAYKLLRQISRRGLPGVVKTIMLYLSTLKKEAIPDASFFISLLSFENMEDLHQQVLDKYNFNLFTIDSFKDRYMEQFGNYQLKDDSDPQVGEMVDEVLKRRIEFIRMNDLKGLQNEIGRLLKNQSSRGIYDMDLFMEYIQLRSKTYDNKKEEYVFLKKSSDSITDDYLNHFFPNEQPNQFLQYVDTDDVMKIYEEKCLLRGDDLIPQYYGSVQSLRDEVRCTIQPTNKMYYDVGDEVKLTVDLKNVTTLDIHVYEINTYSYYKSNTDEINESIDIDGLVPLFQQSYSYNLPSLVLHTEEFTFPSIQHRGIFVIDFVAGHKNCRMLLKMGCLNVLSRDSLAGYALTILDEKGKRLEKDVKVLLDNREYTLNENYEIVIPYLPPNNSSRTVNLLICQQLEENWSYVKMHSMYLQNETISLALAGTVDNEALVPGNEDCTMILRVTANINHCPLPLHLLKDLTVTLQFVDIQGMKSEKILYPTLDSNSCFTYSFRVKVGYASIVASASARVHYNNGNISLINSQKVTIFNSNSILKAQSTVKKVSTTYRLFRQMKKNKLMYFIQAFGPSGESVPNKIIEIRFRHAYLNDRYTIMLQTNEEGQVQLGTLEDVTSFTIDGEEFTMNHDSFNICTTWKTVDCDPIQAQFPVTPEDVLSYNLVCLQCNGSYSDVQPHIDYVYSYLRICNLPAGDYVFYLYLKNHISYSISIHVSRSSREPCVYEDYLFYGNGALHIQDMPFSLQAAIQNDKLQVEIHGGSGKGIVHALCKTFVDSKVMKQSLQECCYSLPNSSCSIQYPSSIVASDRVFADEYAYIRERQKRQRLLPGSMLPAPGLLLNPIEVDTTTTTNKKGEEEKAFANSRRGNKCGESSGYGGSDNGSRGSFITIKSKASLDTILVPSILLFSIPLDEHGCGEVELPSMNHYGYEVHVVGVDNHQMTDRHLYYNISNEEKTVKALLKDAALETNLDPSKHYTEEKKITEIKKGDEVILNDKSELELFTSLSDIWLFLKTLSDNSTLQDFSFLLHWNTYSFNEKKTYYNRYNCSELNIFIYFKDTVFFTTVIKPYLQSKIEKSFLDHYMVGDDVTMYLLPVHYQRLNAFERALLVSRVDASLGKKMVDGMKHTTEYHKMSQERYNYIFETALKLKSMNKDDKVNLPKEKEKVVEMEVEEECGCLDEDSCYSVPSAPPMLKSNRYIPSNDLYCMAAPVPRMEMNTPVRHMAMAFSASRMEMTDVGCAAPPPPPPQAMSRRLCYAAPRRRVADEAIYKEKKVEKHYEMMEKTKEYKESYYYQSKTMYSPTSLVPLSPFWVAFAEYLQQPTGCFNSKDFIYCTHSFSEILFCLAVLDLQFDDCQFTIKPTGSQFTLTCEGPALLFQKVMLEAVNITNDPNLLITQKYIDNNNEYCYVDNQKVERYLTNNEFLPQTPYRCKIFITNISSLDKTVSLLYQIPSHAYPLSYPYSSHTEPMTIPSFSTRTFEYSFYFPSIGDFSHLPTHIVDDKTSTVLAYAIPSFQPLHVTSTLTTIDVTSWRDVSATASDQVVLQYIASHDLTTIDWNAILYRLDNKNFFIQCVSLLREYGYYNRTIWKFGIKHGDYQSTKEFISNEFTKKVGLFFESPLFSIIPEEEDLFQIREYKPFIHNRCINLGKTLTISNDKLEKQYEKFLKYMTMKKPTTNDYAQLVYYLILQDRITEASTVFKTKVCDEIDGEMVRKPDCTCIVQCDYMIAYFDCFKDGLQQARKIVQQYENYPVAYWNELFKNIASLIQDYDNKPEMEEEDDERDPINLPRNEIRSKRLAASSDTSLSLEIHDTKLAITSCSLPSVIINLYEVNVELLFSKNPFIRDFASTSLFIRPNYSEMISITSDSTDFVTTEYTLPKEYQTKNVLVEVIHGDLRETGFAFNNQLLVRLSTKSGQLRVFNKTTQRPLACTYVKVYAKTNNGCEFLKDGYTDIRGYFDYYSVSTDVAERATRLSIFIDKDGFGSCIRETVPPISAK